MSPRIISNLFALTSNFAREAPCSIAAEPFKPSFLKISNLDPNFSEPKVDNKNYDYGSFA